MVKKPTITCKVCGGEHSGTICKKFTSVRVLPPKERAAATKPLLLAPPAKKPTVKKAKKAKKKKRTKKRTPKSSAKSKTVSSQANSVVTTADISPDKTGEPS